MSMPALTAAQRKRLADIVGGASSRTVQRVSGSRPSQKERTYTATTRSGSRCRNAPAEGSDHCSLHQRR
jgi:hypothetical protein